MSPELIVTLLSVGLLLLLVLTFRMHAFPALLLVSLFAALGGGMGVDLDRLALGLVFSTASASGFEGAVCKFLGPGDGEW